MHTRLLVGSAALVLLASVVACSGSKSADPGATDEPAETATPGPAAGDPAAPAAAKEPAPSDAPPPVSDGGAPEASTAAGDGGGGGGGPVNPQCQASSVHESGSNDTPDTANAIPAASGTFCGTLDSATDVDFVTFTLPAGTTSLGFGLAYSQTGLEIEGTAGGETFVVGSKPAFKPGQKYVLKVHSSGTTPVSYLLSVDIKQ